MSLCHDKPDEKLDMKKDKGVCFYKGDFGPENSSLRIDICLTLTYLPLGEEGRGPVEAPTWGLWTEYNPYIMYVSLRWL